MPHLWRAHSHMVGRIQRLGCRRVTTAQPPGDYQLTDEALTIYLHPQPEAHVGATMVRLTLEQGRVTDVLSPLDGAPLFPIFLEPELLSGVRGASRQVREWIPLAQIPPHIIDTVLTIEDGRFYSHFGIDPVAVGRALWAHFRDRHPNLPLTAGLRAELEHQMDGLLEAQMMSDRPRWKRYRQ